MRNTKMSNEVQYDEQGRPFILKNGKRIAQQVTGRKGRNMVEKVISANLGIDLYFAKRIAKVMPFWKA